MKKCEICNKEETPLNEPCFTCRFWNRLLKDDSESLPYTVAIIDGHHYFIEPEDSPSEFRGFGGRRFQIEFNDGTRVITTNLWYQGEIPPEWIDKFPNNARFENNFKWQKIGENEYLEEPIL